MTFLNFHSQLPHFIYRFGFSWKLLLLFKNLTFSINDKVKRKDKFAIFIVMYDSSEKITLNLFIIIDAFRGGHTLRVMLNFRMGDAFKTSNELQRNHYLVHTCTTIFKSKCGFRSRVKIIHKFYILLDGVPKIS